MRSRSNRFTRHKIVGGLAAVFTVAGLAAAVAPAAASASPHTLPGSMPRWLHQAHEQGALPSSQRIGFGVLLGMRDPAAAQAQVQADRKSVV